MKDANYIFRGKFYKIKLNYCIKINNTVKKISCT